MPDLTDRLFHHTNHREILNKIDAWGRCLEAKIDQLTKQGEQIMSTQNQSGQALQDAVTKLEQTVADMGTKISTEISDFQAQVTADLAAAGVPSSLVDAVTARVTTLTGNIATITGAVTAADPGPVVAPTA